VSADYDPYAFDGPAFTREYLSPRREPAPVQLQSAAAAALPPGGYSYCWDCSPRRGRGYRCTTPEQFARMRRLPDAELYRPCVPVCPLDLADELRRRGERRIAIREAVTPLETKPRRRWRLWRKEN